jgi:hypothetical protein
MYTGWKEALHAGRNTYIQEGIIIHRKEGMNEGRQGGRQAGRQAGRKAR